MAIMCPVVTPDIQKLADKITQTYPEAAKRAGFDATMCAEWVGRYNSDNNKNIDFIPEVKALVDHIERLRNMSGKSFLYIPEKVEYTPIGKKKQTYNVIGPRIFNKDGVEVFSKDSKDRRRIYANLAVQQGRAVVVEYKDRKYVVNNRNQIISAATGDEMKWGEENGDRKEILRLAQIAFREKEKTASATINSNAASEERDNYVRQLMEHLKASGINVFDRAAMNKFFKEHPNIAPYIQRMIDNKNNNSALNNYGTDRRTEKNQQFPEILGNAGREKEASRTLATAANDTRRGQSNDGREEGFPKEKFLAYLEVSARQQGTWIDDVNSLGNKLRDKGGAESELYLSKDGKSYIKLNRFTMLDEQHNIEEFVDRINSHNEFEKYAPYSILGFAEDSKGNVCIVLKQPIIKGKEATQKEIDDFLGNVLHYEWKTLSDGTEGWTNGVYEIWDADPSNVLKDSKNNLYFIDIVINNTERLAKYRAIDNIQMMQTSEGEIYGFVDKEGNMYLDETIIDASHPIHEYAHLWDRALAKTNPELWKKGVNLMQEGVPGLWNEIANSANYGKLWQSNGIKGEKLVNLIASEVHSRLVGDNGAKLLDQIAKENGNEGIIVKLKQWILDAWKELKATFSNWSQEEIDKLTLKDFNHMTVRDFADGINPNTISIPSNAAPELGEERPEGLVRESIRFSLTPEEIAAAERKQAEANKPKPERPNSAAYESALKTNESEVAKFKRTFSPQQVKDRGAMIADMFSNILDEAVMDEIDNLLDVVESDTATEEDKVQAKQRINALRDPVNGRQLAAQEKGVPVILNEIRQLLEDYMESAEEDKKLLYQNTLDYFEDLFNTQASLDIEEKEGIRIVDLKIEEQNATEEDNDSQDDGNEEIGHVVSGSDGWSFQVRFTDPFNTLSRKVRSMLYDVDRPASEVDDLGMQRKYPMGQIYASFLSYLSKHMENADDFVQIDKGFEEKDRWGNDIIESTYPNGYPTFPVLEEMKKVYPWVQQIIDRLTDDYIRPDWNTNLRYPSTGGAMASQFYTNFRKAYIPYAKIQLGDGKFGITPLNYEMEERAQLDKLEANYNNRMILSPHSVYNSDGTVNKENAKWLKQAIQNTVRDLDQGSLTDYLENPELYSEEDLDALGFDKFVSAAREILQSFGIDATQDSVVAYMQMGSEGAELRKMLSDLEYIADRVLKVDDEKVASFNYMVDLRNPYNENVWTHFFDGRGLITDASYMQSYYDSASHKTKYSYSADNYLMKTFRGAAMGTKEQRQRFLDEKFGRYEWFRDQSQPRGKGWRNKWIEFWYNYDGEQKEIPYRNIDNITEYGENGATIRPYSKWEPSDIWQVQNRSYASDSKASTAFYLAPIFSDSPMSMTVRGPRMNMDELLYGYVDSSGVRQQGAFVQLVNQEMYRINYVQQRAQAIARGDVKAIANFDDKRGRQFCFLPELNSYVFADTNEKFIDRMVRLKAEKATASDIEASEIQAIQDILSSKLGQYNAENMESKSDVQAEQYYNMVYANTAIIQMTTVDLAFYKDDTDFQKRFKEVYAGGIQLNTNSKYGRKTENVILLADDIITSPSYDKIAAIINGSESLSQDDKERILSVFTDINVADAQAIRSMHSFRSILDMMGNWTDEMEEALNHFKSGEWNREDFDVIYQTIKPFVYAVIDRNDGFGGTIAVPQQNKNSEICALMMYDLITNGLNESPVYKALSKFMEDNVDGNGEHLIDMAQYESAGKVGNQGVINISFNPNKVVSLIENGATAGGDEFEFNPAYVDGKYLDNTVENAERNYRAIKEDMDNELTSGAVTQEQYNKIIQYLRPTEDEIVSMLEQAVLVHNPDGTKGINTEVVHTIPFDNYYQQQPTPEHHIDSEAIVGSQARNIIVADLPNDFELVVPGKGKAKHTFKGKDAVVDFFYELMNENLIEDFFGKGNKKGLKGIFESKESLRDAIMDIVRGNPKYGRDFVEAMQLDENGNFVLSPNSPTIFTLMQEIVTSFFKNRITKQKINGASLIQAAGIGLDENLRLEFDENGKLLGAHCLMPLTSKKFFEPLLETQIINGKEVKVLTPEKLRKAGLDKAIGYRIPTENKSSMMPLILDGFTPLQNGSAIVLPAEITAMAGSDFDVDKMFIMLLSFYIQNYDMRAAREAYAKEDAVFKEMLAPFTNSQLAEELLSADTPEFNEWFEEHKDEFELDEPIIRKVEYDFSKTPKENGRKARNNMIIQMMFGILTSKAGSESLFNPQGFPDVEHAAKVVRILTDPRLKEQLLINTSGMTTPGVLPSPETIVSEFLSLLQEKYPNKYDEYKQAVLKMTAEQVQQAYIQAMNTGNKDSAVKLLLDSSTKDLENFIKKYSAPESPVYPQTFAHSHARNMAGANQIGIYAIQGSMDAKYQRATVRMREEQRFKVDGREYGNVDVSDEGRRLKNVGQMIGASADNGKKPNLTDMGSTTKTAPMIGYMLRTGLSHLEAALIINQPHMWMSKYSSKSWKYWKNILGKNPLATEAEVTTDMLIKSLMSPFELTAEEDKAIAALCYRILMQHEAQEYLTQISRADSPNGAMKNSYAKARIQRYKVDLFQAKMGQKDFPFVRINDAISNNAIDTAAPEDVIREQLKGQRMAFLHGMYALGINSFNDLVNPYFFGAQKWFDDGIVKPILYNLNERLSDEEKERIVDGIYRSYITYMLSGSSLFGNEEGSSMKSKRDYYLESFPDDYIKIIQENEDIKDLLSNVLQVRSFGSRKRVVLQDVGSLSKGQKQDIQRRFDALAYSDNPVARNLAKDLLIYSYFDNGLQFTHDSFSHLFTTEYMLNFPVYNDTLLRLEDEITPDGIDNFIAQFLLTYPEAAYNVSEFLDRDYVNGDVIRIDLNNKQLRKRMINEVMSPNPQSEGINVYPYIRYNGEVYVLDKDLFEQWPGSPVYRKLIRYQTFSRLPLFSIQMSAGEMAKEFPVGENETYDEQPSVDGVGPAPNEGYEDPSVDNSADFGPDEFDGFEMDEDIEPDAPQSKSENYQNEGEGELRDPFCVM